MHNSDSAPLASPTPSSVREAGAASALAASSAPEAGEPRALTKAEEIDEALACPCIDAMRDGSCGDQFLGAYRCFLESETEPQGMECTEFFGRMTECMAKHPVEYGLDEDGGGEGGVGGGVDEVTERLGESAIEEGAEEVAVEEAEVSAREVVADAGEVVDRAVEEVAEFAEKVGGEIVHAAESAPGAVQEAVANEACDSDADADIASGEGKKEG